jgi:hypothetical protein
MNESTKARLKKAGIPYSVEETKPPKKKQLKKGKK